MIVVRLRLSAHECFAKSGRPASVDGAGVMATDDAISEIERLLARHPDWSEALLDRYDAKLAAHAGWQTATARWR